MTVIVTTTRKLAEARLRIAEDLAGELALPLVLRGTQSVDGLRRTLGAEGAIVVEADRVVYHHPDGTFFYHPSMAKVRIRQMTLGRPDIAVEAMGLSTGMSVLDCTLGRAADACVAAAAVGPAGRVVGLEADPIVAALTRLGLQEFDAQSPRLNEVMRRIEVVCEDHETYLQAAADGSFDVVYFDPFFEEALSGAQAMEGLRTVGRHGCVSRPALEHAVRVARLRVVYKAKRDACPSELASWRAHSGRKSRVEYRILDIEGAQR